jgi:predicted TIM-barrel fold metal-dependent hydrolase
MVAGGARAERLALGGCVEIRQEALAPERTISRRGFALGVGSLALGANADGADVVRVPVVDMHLHCFADRTDSRFPHHPRAAYESEKPATPEQLLKCMDGAGVDFAVVVHPEPYQDDHRYLEHCLEVGKGRLKGTCLFFAGSEGLRERMTALTKKVPLVAARVHAYAPERLPPFGKPEMRELWKLAGDLGLAVQVHLEPRYAEGLEPLIREFKDVTVIVDHLGRPMQGTPEEHARVVNWSRFPNTVMKVSAVPERRQYPHRDPAPVIKQLADAYGADRLIHGGGFGEGATPASYRAARERIAGLLAHLGEADRAKVLGGTAARLFGFRPPAR